MNDDGSCIFPGCSDSIACNYDPMAGCSDSSCVYPEPNYDCTGNCINDINTNGICDELETGCSDTTACNYNPEALIPDNSCTYPGCRDSMALNYNPAAGCGADSLLCEYLSGVEEIEWMVSLYPVPASDQLNIQFPAVMLGSEMRIVEISGRVMLAQRIQNDHLVVDVSTWSSGYYQLLLMRDGLAISRKKFIITP
jgi:hypothetical protein